MNLLSSAGTAFWTIVAFVLALGPLVILHELGHYTVARLCGVKVLRFSIGFGRPLFKWVRGRDRTEWVVSPIPLGGYVAMLDEREVDGATIAPADLPRAFNRQPVMKRIAIVVAGPLTNLLIAVLLYAGLNLVGVEEPRAAFSTPEASTDLFHAGIDEPFEVVALDDEPLRSVVDLRWRLLKIGIDRGVAALQVRRADGTGPVRTVKVDLARLDATAFEGEFMSRLGLQLLLRQPGIGEVSDPEGRAATAGLKAGDRIVSIDDRPIDDVETFRRILAASPERRLAMTVERGGAEIRVDVTPAASGTNGSVGVIGVYPTGRGDRVKVRYGPVDAVARGAAQTWDLCVFSLRMIGKMVAGQVSLKNISGPVTIADYAKQSLDLGPLFFINFVAFISISLGVMNLLPIPMLDGGHLLYYSAEIVRGRPPSERFLEWSQRAGLFLLGSLMVVALFNDFLRKLS